MFLVLVVLGGYAIQANAKSLVLSDEQDKWLGENLSNISFAPEKDFPPMIWSKYDTLFGVSKDYFDLIQQLIDVRFQVREPRKLTEILESIKAGEQSIVSSRTMTPERSEYLLFTRPYFSSPSIFVSQNKKTMTGAEIEQQGYTVSVANQFGAHEYLKNRYPEMKLVTFDNNYQVIQAVVDGRADIAAIDVTSLMYLVKENNFSGFRKIGDTGFIANFAFAVPKNLLLLRNILDNAVEVIPQSSKEAILEKWGVNSIDAQFLADEKAALAYENNAEEMYFTIFLVIALFLILFNEFILFRYISKREREKSASLAVASPAQKAEGPLKSPVLAEKIEESQRAEKRTLSDKES